jgi:hypothetical protein
VKKHLYLITVEDDVEPEIIGPFKDEGNRDHFAKELREKYEFDGGIYPLDIKSEKDPVKVAVWAYSGGLFSAYEESGEVDESTIKQPGVEVL